MTEQTPRQIIRSALGRCAGGRLGPAAAGLFGALGYRSERTADTGGDPATFLEFFPPGATFNPDRALRDDWLAADVLFQLTDDDLRRGARLDLFNSAGVVVDNAAIESYLFLAFDLRGDAYGRGRLAAAAREINKLFAMPALILFRYGGTLTLAVINRRLHKRDAGKDVLEKVTLIKDIRATDPHRAHIEILHDLSLERLMAQHGAANFVELHRAWQKTLDSSELNKRFFREVADWYFWAVGRVVFPAGAEPDETRNPTGVIRLLTRLIFVWFLREKGLVPDDLFSERKLAGLLRRDDPQGSAYYKAILQNLFFATLNTEMGDGRRFRGKGRGGDHDRHYGIPNVYRYEDYFTDPARAVALFASVPFLNGGLFECLDRPAEGLRVDGFSDRADNPLRVPDELFFGDEREVDLNAVYDTQGRRYRTRGLIRILERYKFTIDENTPIEEEIALDPELLGRVFENLLAAYNPETGTTARKATGSFYTPREIVNYMVDEALIAYLEAQAPEAADDGRLRALLAYRDDPHGFSETEVERLIAAIDRAKILDPACGSGAFPMGALHKLVFVLGKLDPGNGRWKERQLAPLRRMRAEAETIDDPTVRRQTLEDVDRRMAGVEAAFARNELDYGRKLYLIENCLYGVDIQPIAVQIAKLRVFISLVVDQRIDDGAPNRGVLPLPNLETKFAAANTLLGIERGKDEFSAVQGGLMAGEVERMRAELKDVRHRYFTARTPETKRKYRARDEELRKAIAAELGRTTLGDETVGQMAAWDPYDQNVHAGFFDPEWMFGVRGGFDIVIGNPPYVRQEKIRELKPALQRRYECYTGTADLYVYFFEAGYRLLRPGGALVYISSNKYFRAAYGRKLRELLGARMTIRQLIDFGDAPVFTAIAYPSIILATKDAPGSNRLRAFNWEPGPPIESFVEVFGERRFAMPQSALAADGWQLEDAATLALLDKLRRGTDSCPSVPLGEYVGGRFYYGIKTGLNEAFVVDRATRDRLIAEDPRSAELLKPFLRGRDVKRWRVEPKDLWLIFTRHGTDIEQYPAIKRHLLPYKERLMPRPPDWEGSWPGRKPGSYKWFEIQDNIAYWEEFERPKIIYPNICRRNEFAWDSGEYYSNQKTFIIPNTSTYLLAILNSSVVTWLFDKLLAKLQNGYYEPSAVFLEKFPVPVASDTKPLEQLAEQTLIQAKLDPSIDISDLEREIDQLVYALYNLTDAEIALIEGETRDE